MIFLIETRKQSELCRFLGFLFALTAASGLLCTVRGGLADDILSLTNGRHARVVWTHQLTLTNNNTQTFRSMSDEDVLMGFDTRTGTEKTILDESSSYVQPIITPNGDRIVYTKDIYGQNNKEVFVVNWDGSGKRRITGNGYACDVWKDPVTDMEYVTVNKVISGPEIYNELTEVWQYPLDGDTSAKQMIWAQDSVRWVFWKISGDGKKAVGDTPWPYVYIFNLEDGTKVRVDEEKYGDDTKGCFPNIARDNSYYFFINKSYFLVMYNAAMELFAKIEYAPAWPYSNLLGGRPEWSNDRQFMTVIGPYENENQETSISELNIGRFTPDLTQIDEWVRVTKNETADKFGFFWVEPGAASTSIYRPVRLLDFDLSSTRPTRMVYDLHGRRIWPATCCDLVLVPGIMLDASGNGIRKKRLFLSTQ